MSLATLKNDAYSDMVENYRIAFNGFRVFESGLSETDNILFLIEVTVEYELSNDFQKQLCAGLEAIGVKINDYLTIIVDDMGNEDYLLRRIRNYVGIKYFLMIGENFSYNAIMKSIKLKTDVRGNYKDYKNINYQKDNFRLCLEINKQCRGVNYLCSTDFPKNVAFFHFILSDDLIACGTNALKFQSSHIMVPFASPKGNTDFVQVLKHLCNKITGKTKNNFYNKIVITFENYFSLKSFSKIALMMYNAVSKSGASADIGVAEIILIKPFKPKAQRNVIKSCHALIYDNELNSDEILKMLHLCRICNQLRLKIDEKTALPGQVMQAIFTYENISLNYENYSSSKNVYLSDSDDEEYEIPCYLKYPKIKLRNHIMMLEEDEFSITPKKCVELKNSKILEETKINLW